MRRPTIAEPVEELERRMRHESEGSGRLRLHLLVLLARGTVGSRQAAAAHLGVHRNTVGRWLAAYAHGGVEELLAVEHPGAPCTQKSLSPVVWAALQARLADPSEAGGFDSYVEVQQWLERKHGCRLPYATVHKLVHYRLGAKLKRARPSHVKRTPRR